MSINIKGKTVYGPNVVTDGLVLYLDAANTRSLNLNSNNNLIPNPGFETGSALPWTYQTVASGGSISTEIVKDGTYSYKLQRVDTSGEVNCYYSIGTALNLTPGKWYTFSMDVWCDTATSAYLITYLGQSAITSSNHPGDSSWHRLVSWFMPASDKKAQIRFVLRSQTGAAIGYFDNAEVIESPYWYDLSHNSNDGIIFGCGFDSSNNGSIIFTKEDKNFIKIPYSESISLDSADFTVSIWIKIPISSVGEGNPSQWGPIITNGCTTSAPANSWWIAQTSTFDNAVTLNISSDTGGTFLCGLNSGAMSNGWHNVVITRSSDDVFLYVDGIYKSTKADIPANLNKVSDLFICTNSSNPVKLVSTSVANIMIYKNRALNSTEISQNYNALKSRFTS